MGGFAAHSPTQRISIMVCIYRDLCDQVRGKIHRLAQRLSYPANLFFCLVLEAENSKRSFIFQAEQFLTVLLQTAT
jgi:hypothetical protein